jgi:hypothetical protein
MVRKLTTRFPCACSVEEFWGLREDPEWDHYNAELDGQIFTTLNKEEVVDPKNGAVKVVRSHRLKAKSNPIPKPIRAILGTDEFVVRVHAQWFKLKYSHEDAMTLTVLPPVLSERIKIFGEQWAERVDDNNCMLCTSMQISCKIPGPGIGFQVEKGTEKGMKGAYADQPRRVLTFLAERRKHGRPYPDPFVQEAKRAQEAKKAQEAAGAPTTTGGVDARLADADGSPRIAAHAGSAAESGTRSVAAALAAAPPPFSSPLTTQAIGEPQRPTPPTGPAPPASSASVASTSTGSSAAAFGYDVNSPGGAPVLALRQAIVAQRGALREAEMELETLVHAEEQRVNQALAAAVKQLESLQRELSAERAHSATLQQKLEDTRADLREERLRTQELGNALASAMRQLKDAESELGGGGGGTTGAGAGTIANANAGVGPPLKAPQPSANGAVRSVLGARGGALEGMRAKGALAPKAADPAATAAAPPRGETEDEEGEEEDSRTSALRRHTIMGDVYDDDDDEGEDVEARTSALRRHTIMGDVYDDDDEEEEGEWEKDGVPPPVAKSATAPALVAPPPPLPPPKAASAAALAGESPLTAVLHSLSDGLYRDEALEAHVGLGGRLLLASDRRLLYVKKGSWDLLWQLPYGTIVSAERAPDSSEVLLRLTSDPNEWESTATPPTRSISCMTSAIVPLVLETVQGVLAKDVAKTLKEELAETSGRKADALSIVSPVLPMD